MSDALPGSGMAASDGPRGSICVVAHDPGTQGAERAMLDMALYLGEAGWEVSMLLPADSGPLVDLVRASGLEYYSRTFYYWIGTGAWQGRMKRTARNLVSVSQIAWFFRKHQFDVVYSHSLAAGVPAIAARLAQCPHVWHLHEFGPYQLDDPHPSFDLGEAISLRTIRWTRSVMVAVAAVIRDTFEKRLPGMDFRVAYQPIPFVEGLDPGDAAAIEAIRFSTGPNIICVGAITATKRQDEAIKAMATLKQRLPDARLFLAGRVEPKYRSHLEQLAHELGVSDSVEYLGYVRNAPGLIGLCDISINCRRAEASPRGVVESMMAGTFVIAAGQGGNVEALEGGLGKLYEPGNADDLAKQMLWFIDHPIEAQRIVRRAKDEAHLGRSELLNVTRYVDEIESAIAAARKV